MTISNAWNTGYQAAITAKNTGTASVNPWTVSFTLPAGVTIGNGWNGTFAAERHDGHRHRTELQRHPRGGGDREHRLHRERDVQPGAGAVKLNGAVCS